jgi:hypothetical protein
MPACKVSMRVVECERFPLVPSTARVKVPVGALTAAPSTTGALLFTAKLKGLEGFVCTPLGKPLNVTCTESANPFCPVTDTLSAEVVVPCSKLIAFEETVMEKSWTKGGGSGGDPPDPPPPLQPA